MAHANYEFVNAQLVAVFVPPASSEQMYQVTGSDPVSGIAFVQIWPRLTYEQDPAAVASFMDSLGAMLNSWSKTPGVQSIATTSTIDNNSNVQYELDVVVVSTSGKSTTHVASPYPTPDFPTFSDQTFTTLIQETVAMLDAAEAA